MRLAFFLSESKVTRARHSVHDGPARSQPGAIFRIASVNRAPPLSLPIVPANPAYRLAALEAVEDAILEGEHALGTAVHLGIDCRDPTSGRARSRCPALRCHLLHDTLAFV